MSSLYRAVVKVVRRVLVVTGIPVPALARRVHAAVRHRYLDAEPLKTRRAHAASEDDLRQEVAALARAVERLETSAYLDRIGRSPD